MYREEKQRLTKSERFKIAAAAVCGTVLEPVVGLGVYGLIGLAVGHSMREAVAGVEAMVPIITSPLAIAGCIHGAIGGKVVIAFNKYRRLHNLGR